MLSFLKAKNVDRRAGDAHRNAEEWESAADAYSRHLTRRPDDFAIWVQLGHVEKEARRFDRAEAAYRRAAALRPDDPDPVLHLAHLLKRQYKFVDALVAFRQLNRLSPHDEAEAAIKELARKRLEGDAVPEGRSGIFLAIDDLLAALDQPAVRTDVIQSQAALLAAILEEPNFPAQFVVCDDLEERGALLCLDPSVVADIVGHARRGVVDSPSLHAKIFDARIAAVPIGLRPGSMIVLMSPSAARGSGIGRFREVQHAGARLVALVRQIEPTGSSDRFGADSAWALAEMLYAADLVLPVAEDVRSQIERRIEASAVPMMPAPPATAAHRDSSASADTAEVLAALRALGSQTIPPRGVMPISLAEGATFMPASITWVAPDTASYANPQSLALAEGFGAIDERGAWLRGRTGELRFRVSPEVGDRIVIMMGLVAAPWAVGLRCSVAFAESDTAALRREFTLSGDPNPVRIEATVLSDRTCVLRIAVTGEVSDDASDVLSGALALAAIGYCRMADRSGRMELRENVIFG